MLQGELDCQLKNIAELHDEANKLLDDGSAKSDGAVRTRDQLLQIDRQAELVQSKLNDRLQHVTDALTEVI